MTDVSANNKIESALSAALLPALMIGVPFCIFKFIFGVMALRIGAHDQIAVLTLLGYTVIIWASIDLLMNLMHALGYFFHWKVPIEFCIIAQFGRLFGRARLFLAIDTFLSFLIICFFLWSGWITRLTQIESYCWYAATTINLISLSIVNIVSEFKYKQDLGAPMK